MMQKDNDQTPMRSKQHAEKQQVPTRASEQQRNTRLLIVFAIVIIVIMVVWTLLSLNGTTITS